MHYILWLLMDSFTWQQLYTEVKIDLNTVLHTILPQGPDWQTMSVCVLTSPCSEGSVDYIHTSEAHAVLHSSHTNQLMDNDVRIFFKTMNTAYHKTDLPFKLYINVPALDMATCKVDIALMRRKLFICQMSFTMYPRTQMGNSWVRVDQP